MTTETETETETETATPFPTLFSPLQIGTVQLRNRLVLGGHGTRFVDWHDHHVVERQAHYFAERAKGGVAAIIQGSAMVHPTGLATGGVNEIWSDDSIPSYRMLADAVHEHGTVMIGQLSHLGRQGHTFGAQRELWAPSAIPDPASRVVPHAMTRKDIVELIDAYRSASARFLAADFDGIEVYLAHGYLLCEFLSRFSNTREDEYGGSLENRLRLPLEVLRAVREEVGAGVPVGIRVSADEFSPDGLVVGETTEIVERLLDAIQIDYVSVTQSNYASMETMIPDMSFPRAPYVHYAATIRKVTQNVPVLTVARIVTPERCESLLTDGTADAICLVRPLIADPEFPNKAREGRRDQIRECISCNVGCRGGPHRGMPIACLVNPVVGHEKQWGIGKLRPAERSRRVLVVGGGPAGLKAAETAALRGHDVTLVEAQERLGGQVLTAAAAMPYRDEFANSVRQLESEILRLGVRVERGRTVDVGTIAELAPDVVVVATGSVPTRPHLPGDGADRMVSAQDAILHGVTGPRVVVLDSGEADWKALTTAERLATDGHEVTLVSPVPVGAEIDAFSRPPLLRRLRRAGVRFVEYHSATAVHLDRVTIRESFTGEEHDVPADAVVTAWYGQARNELFNQLAELGIEAHAVGDCLAPRRAIDAIWDGFRIGRTL
jgi:2,4-dienoyl-CoA reductase-like NADH-dependent reductase (Old Yellow Enzyme family)/thioredoxin reductase